MPPRRAADVLHDLFCRFLHRPGFLSHLRSFKGYDEPEILPSSTRRICLIGADAGQKSTKGVNFPFCDNPNKLDDFIKLRNLTRAGPEVVALVKSLKPYKGGNIALRAIH